MTSVYPIVYISNDTYVVPTIVSAVSALLCLKRGKVHFHICADNMSKPMKELLHHWLDTTVSSVFIHDMDMSEYVSLPDWKGSRLTWTRTRLHYILPDIEGWVVNCDGDSIWMRGPEELFDELETLPRDVVVAGSHSNHMGKDRVSDRFSAMGYKLTLATTFCMGISACHLDRMRETDTFGLTKDFVAKHGAPRYLEQDVFNVIYRDCRHILSKGWGAFSKNYAAVLPPSEIGIVHFVGDLPWTQGWRICYSDLRVLWRYVGDELTGLSAQSPMCQRKPWSLLAMKFFRVMWYVGLLPQFVTQRMYGKFVKIPLLSYKRQFKGAYEHIYGSH